MNVVATKAISTDAKSAESAENASSSAHSKHHGGSGISLSAIILAFDAPGAPACDEAVRCERISSSVASLVHACAYGLVSETIVVGAPTPQLHQAAEECGCRVVEAPDRETGFSAALEQARHPYVFIIEAGTVVERSFADELCDEFASNDFDHAHVMRIEPDSFAKKMIPSLSPPVGVIGRRDAIMADGACDIPTLGRKLRAKNLGSRARAAS